MSKLEVIRHLYAYNEWANEHLLDVAGELDENQLSGAQGTSFESILGNMAHLWAAQVNWLERWKIGQNTKSTVEMGETMKTLAGMQEAFASSHAHLREYIAGLSDHQLDSHVEYRDRSGNRAGQPLWQPMVHVSNHGTFHRGEVAMVLTALGHSPGELDFLFWKAAQAAG